MSIGLEKYNSFQVYTLRDLTIHTNTKQIGQKPCSHSEKASIYLSNMAAGWHCEDGELQAEKSRGQPVLFSASRAQLG